VAKKGTAGVASEVRAPGAAPSADTNAVAANADAPGDSASAAESDRETRLSLDALSLGTSAGGPGGPGGPGDPGGPGPEHTPGVVGPDGAPGTAAGAESGAGAYAAYPGYNAYGYPSGTAYEASSGPVPVPSGMYPQHMVPPGMPGMPGMLSPELAMQQQHAAMLYHQQTDPAAVFAYYRAAAESGDPQAAEALKAMRASLPAEPLEGSKSPVDAPGGGGAGNLGAPTHFSAEMYAAQMHQLSQMGAHHMHAPMWDPRAAAYGNNAAGWTVGPSDARHQQWQQHAGYARAWGAHDPDAHAPHANASGRNGAMGNYPYARGAYDGDGAGGWKPPSPRLGGGGRRNRRENGRSARRSERRDVATRGDVGFFGARASSRGSGSGRGGPLGDSKPSSALLEAFKQSARKTGAEALSLADVAGHVSEFARDQHGSRFIQQRLETASREEIAQALEEILPDATELAADVFGNYVVQKFFERGDDAVREALVDRLRGNVLRLSLHAYGCRVVQKALELVDDETKAALAFELDGNVLRCVRDQNGNHVVQKCVEVVELGRLGFMLDALAGHVSALSAHPYGCRVIQRALERCKPYCPTPDAFGNAISEISENAKHGTEPTVRFSTLEILRDAGSLSKDQYGNYVVQHVLQHGDDVSRKSVLSTLAGQIVPLAQHKFASNVVEKCLTYCGAEEREIMIGEILGVGPSARRDLRVEGSRTTKDEVGVEASEAKGEAKGEAKPSVEVSVKSSSDARPGTHSQTAPVAPVPPLQAMMKDQFANYVVQKLLEVCDDDQRERLLASARAHLQAVKKVSYGKHIVARVEKLVVEVNGGGASGAKAEARVVEDEKAGPGLGPGEEGEERSG
jgi:hypothetical protein